MGALWQILETISKIVTDLRTIITLIVVGYYGVDFFLKWRTGIGILKHLKRCSYKIRERLQFSASVTFKIHECVENGNIPSANSLLSNFKEILLEKVQYKKLGINKVMDVSVNENKLCCTMEVVKTRPFHNLTVIFEKDFDDLKGQHVFTGKIFLEDRFRVSFGNIPGMFDDFGIIQSAINDMLNLLDAFKFKQATPINIETIGSKTIKALSKQLQSLKDTENIRMTIPLEEKSFTLELYEDKIVLKAWRIKTTVGNILKKVILQFY